MQVEMSAGSPPNPGPQELALRFEPGKETGCRTPPIEVGSSTTRVPVVSRRVPRRADVDSLRGELATEVMRHRGEMDLRGCYEMALALYALDAIAPAVELLERVIARGEVTVGCCELMTKCMVAWRRYESAVRWFMLPLEDASIDADATLELVRQASECYLLKATEHAAFSNEA